jgi:hypothetical protein
MVLMPTFALIGQCSWMREQTDGIWWQHFNEGSIKSDIKSIMVSQYFPKLVFFKQVCILFHLRHYKHSYTSYRCRPRWPRGLRHELSSLARTLGSWVRISLKAWMSVFAFILRLCCPVCRQRHCDGLITRPRSPTDCVKMITKLKKRPGPNRGDVEPLMDECMNEHISGS